MLILIDGYNVLKMIAHKTLVDESERERFIALLSQYARISGNKPYIIFDGGEDSRPLFSNRKNIVVVYSGYRESADAVIKGLLEEEQRNEVLLVSTDRELNRYAENFDIPSMDSVVFYGYVRDRLRQQHDTTQKNRVRQTVNGQIKKFDTQKNTPELDELMESAAKNIIYKDNDVYTSEARNQSYTKKRTSKIDKRLEKVVKKL